VGKGKGSSPSHVARKRESTPKNPISPAPQTNLPEKKKKQEKGRAQGDQKRNLLQKKSAFSGTQPGRERKGVNTPNLGVIHLHIEKQEKESDEKTIGHSQRKGTLLLSSGKNYESDREREGAGA